MSRYNVGVTAGRSNSGSNGNRENVINYFRYDMGDKKHIVIPILKDKDGKERIISLGEPIHRLTSPTFLQQDRDGKKPLGFYNIRCMHPSWQSPDKQGKYSKDHTTCALCNLAKWETRRRYALLNEKYPNDTFSNLSKDEKREAYEEIDKELASQVETVYRKVENGGVKVNLDRYLLALVIETEEEPIPNTTRSKTVVLKDENGVAKYTPVFLPVSDKKLETIQLAAESAFENEVLSEAEFGHSYIEGDIDNGGVEVPYGFVEFLFNYPVKAKKAESGRGLSITTATDKSTIVTQEFIDAVQARSDELIEAAEDSFARMFPALREFTEEDYINLMSDGGVYYRKMKEDYEFTEANVPEGQITDAEDYEAVWESFTSEPRKRISDVRAELYKKRTGKDYAFGTQSAEIADAKESEPETEKVATKTATKATKATKAVKEATPAKADEETVVETTPAEATEATDSMPELNNDLDDFLAN